MVAHFTTLRFYVLAWLALIPLVPAHAQPEAARPRVVVTADPELDDNNSLIRLLLHSNELEIEGLVYASSAYHWKGDGRGTRWFVPGREYTRFGLDTCPCPSWRWANGERFIHDAVEAYAKVYPNLKVHDPRYPAPEKLRAKIRYGNIEFDGDISRDSPGSDLVKALILDNRPGPLFITAWGGQSTIARALRSIELQYQGTTEWEALRRKIARKVVLLPSGDQDDTYATYIGPYWPEIEYRQFRGGPNYGYGAQLNASPENAPYLAPAWMKANITDLGPLGALYRVWGDGKQMVKGDRLDYFGLAGYTNDELKKQGYVVWLPVQPKGAWLGEGDNPTFMNLLGNGLRAHEAGPYGGWGGRTLGQPEAGGPSFLPSGGTQADTSAGAMAQQLGNLNTQMAKSAQELALPNFFPAAQHDLAARLRWSVTPTYAGANHPPAVKIEGPLLVLAAPGEKIRLNGAVTDPDGHAVALRWWQLPMPGQASPVGIDNPSAAQVRVHIPEAASGQQLHLILEATDSGTPALTRYQRVVVKVKGR
jgi:hypothetical protein